MKFPLFPVSIHSPCFARIFISPYFYKFSLCFRKIHLLFTYFLCISFPPYFDHDAFMHHPMHVLDTPGRRVFWVQAPVIVSISVLKAKKCIKICQKSIETHNSTSTKWFLATCLVVLIL